MNIPDKVKIGWREYDVKYVPDLKGNDDVCLMGEIDYNMDISIKLNSDYPKPSLKLTLMHEITHGILYAMGREDLMSDELFVCGFSERLFEFINDNANMFK